MALEKQIPAVEPRLFTYNGGTLGQIQLANTRGFKVGAIAVISAVGQYDLQVKIKRVMSDTLLLVGPVGSQHGRAEWVDISCYTVASSAYICAEQQEKAKIPANDRDETAFDQEPTVAWRNVLVDQLGRYYEEANPLPVQLSGGSLSIENVHNNISVFMSHKDDYPQSGDVHDSIRIGDGIEELAINADNEALVHDQDTHDRIVTLTELAQTEFDQTQILLQTEFDETQTLLQTKLDETKTLLQTEFDQTQTKLDDIHARQSDKAQFTRITDGTNDAGVLATGELKVSITQPLPVGTNVIGIVNQGTSPWITKDQADGPVIPGAAAAFSQLMGGQFNYSLPTLTDTQQSAIQLDSRGRIIVAPLTNTSTIKAQLQDDAGIAITLGQKLMASSVPVVLPSDQTITVTSSPLPTSGSKFTFGQITTTANTQVPVNSTTYTEQTTNAQRSIVSSSANDASAGTGARTVTITYLNAAGNGPFTETVTLNGITPVNTVSTTICFIEKMAVATVGSGGVSAGIVSLKAATAGGGATIGSIGIGTNQTFWCHHYVPAGKTSYISGFSGGTSGSASGQNANFILKYINPTVSGGAEIQISDNIIATGAGNSVSRPYNSPIQAIGPARIRTLVIPGATSSYTTFASFDYIDN